MQEMYDEQWYECHPHTTEPYLLKLGVVPLADYLLVRQYTHNNIHYKYYEPHHNCLTLKILVLPVGLEPTLFRL